MLNDDAVTDTDDRFIAIQQVTISSAANQTFTVKDAPTAAGVITITEDPAFPLIRKKKDLRIRIPASLNLKWDTSITTVTIGGPAASKVKTKLKGYEDGGKTAVVDVEQDFATSDQVTISGLAFTDFSAPSAPDFLELEVKKDGNVNALDDKTRNILANASATILSDYDSVFSVGDGAKAITMFTIADAAATPLITSVNDLRVRIPAGLDLVWDISDTTVTLGGAAASKVSTTVSYEDVGKTLVLDVTADFGIDDFITVSGLKFMDFLSASVDNLELEIGNDGGLTDTDGKTVSIVGATISSAANQVFAVGDPATPAVTITIKDSLVKRSIKKKKDIRIRIPASFNMTWDQSVTAVTLGGGAKKKVDSTIKGYEDGGKTVVLNVKKDFKAGEQVTIDGLVFDILAAPSPADNLELEIKNDGNVSAFDDKTITLLAGTPVNILSDVDQVFSVGAPSTPAALITISDEFGPVITKAKGLRVRIPATFNMTWDTGITTVTLGGVAAGKVSTGLLPYEDGNRTLVLDVTTDFVAGDYITVSGPRFTSFSASSAPDSLELDVFDDNTAADTDDQTLTIIDVSLSSTANQSFTFGAVPTVASILTVSDDPLTGTITALEDIRLRIPAGFNMVWDTTVTGVVLGGSAAGKVSATVLGYEDGGLTAVLDVTADFAGGEQLTVDGLTFMGFAAPSVADNLELKLGNDGTVAALDDKTIDIAAGGSPSILSATDQVFRVLDPSTPVATITVADTVAGVIAKKDGTRIRIPSGFNMTWDTSVTTITLGGLASGKVSATLLPYEDAGRTLVLDVTANFIGGDFITLAGCKLHELHRAIGARQSRAPHSGKPWPRRRLGRPNHRGHRPHAVVRGGPSLCGRRRGDLGRDFHDHRRRGGGDHYRRGRSARAYPDRFQHDVGYERRDRHGGRRGGSESQHERRVRRFQPDRRSGRHHRFLAGRSGQRQRPAVHELYRWLAAGQSGARGGK